MTSATYSPAQSPLFQTLQNISLIIATSAATLVALVILNKIINRFFYVADYRILVPIPAACVFAVFFLRARYADFIPMFRIALRCSAAGLLAVLIFAPPQFTLANPEATLAADYVHYAYYPVFAIAVAALFRPSFVPAVAIYIISSRYLVEMISGLPMSHLDIRYMVDMALYLSVFGIFIIKVAPMLHPWLSAEGRQLEILGGAFGLHLANYFWSGIAKVVAGPTVLTWILENETHNQIPYTIESGILPIGHVPWLADLAYRFIEFAVVPLNAAIVGVQLFAIICILRLSWLKITAVLYDILHLGIFIFGGLFFWPWIWNNMTILWAANHVRSDITLNTKVACVTAVVLGFPALHLNESAWLGWFDIANARQTYFEAVTTEGKTLKVPSAFFLSHSYSVSHGKMSMSAAEGHYDHTYLASADEYERKVASQTCGVSAPPGLQKLDNADDRAKRLDGLNRFLKAHHEKMLERETRLGLANFYFRSHHHPSNPFLYGEFNALSLAKVVGYNLVIESVCHGLADGRVTKKILARTVEQFDVR